MNSYQTKKICLIHVVKCIKYLNSLPNDKVLAWFKLKAFADNLINISANLIFVLEEIKNIVEKGENAGYQKACSQKARLSRSLKVGIVWYRVNNC